MQESQLCSTMRKSLHKRPRRIDRERERVRVAPNTIQYVKCLSEMCFVCERPYESGRRVRCKTTIGSSVPHSIRYDSSAECVFPTHCFVAVAGQNTERRTHSTSPTVFDLLYIMCVYIASHLIHAIGFAQSKQRNALTHIENNPVLPDCFCRSPKTVRPAPTACRW